VVHIIELSSAIHGRYNDDALPNVLVNLSSRSRTSSVRHVVLVLKAESPVHWHISIQRLHCSLDVIVSAYFFVINHHSDVMMMQLVMRVLVMRNMVVVLYWQQ